MLAYSIPASGHQLTFTEDVITQFQNHRQKGRFTRERGGQLFAEFDAGNILICHATGPKRQDRRGRFFFKPDRLREQREINKNFHNGIHYVGDWHTHPEDRPTPSHIDIDSMKDCVTHSIHQLDAFVLVIVGRLQFPDGLSVTLHGNNTVETLTTSTHDLCGVKGFTHL